MEEHPAVPFGRSVERPNHLTPLEAKSGWRLLFDGESTEGWVGLGEDGSLDGWDVVDGCLHRAKPARDIVTTEEFGDFELEFEWKVAKGVNSGLKYRLQKKDGRVQALGCEYQVLDDANRGEPPIQQAAAIYAIQEPYGSRPAPTGEWNRARIVARGNLLEHWLNGVRVLRMEVGSEEWNRRKAASKFRGVASFGEPTTSPILLQEHGGEVWYRNLKIREYDEWPGEEVVLFDGSKIEGWRELGDAIYEADEGSILGRIGGGGQSFLVTERSFGDFILEVEVKTELPGNSGIQVRSHQRPNGRLFGYQIEIDSSERAWSAGLYDEARRGWLQNLKDNEPGRRAFRNGDWNLYHIECIGPWIRVWLNGVPTVDYFDTADLEGVIGLQVHSGNNTRVRWRNFRMHDLGQCRWTPVPGEAGKVLDDPMFGSLIEVPDGNYALRLRYRSSTGQVMIGGTPVEAWHDGQSVQEEPDLQIYERGTWSLRTVGEYHAKHLKPGETNELTACCFGGRVIVHLNGRLTRRFRHLFRSGPHQVHIEKPAPESEPLEIEAVELLEWD